MDRKEFGNLILENERQLYREIHSEKRRGLCGRSSGGGDESIREAAYPA